jgi:hypothetical protein
MNLIMAVPVTLTDTVVERSMITCARCGSERIACVSANSAKCNIWILDKEYDGPVPDDVGLGKGGLMEFSYCMECGQMMGAFPIPPAKMERVKLAEPLDKDMIEKLLKGQ